MSGSGPEQTSLFPPEPVPDPLLCWLWLAQTLGAASSHAGRVLDAFGGAQEAWEARGTDAFRQAAGAPAAQRAAQPANTPEHYRALVRRCEARNIRILPYDDPDYPLAFSRIPDMPLVLYCTGDPCWLNEPGTVGMVGTRRPTEYGLQAAAALGGELAKNGAIIVSGLADGLDSAGHYAAVRENCPTIGVLGVPIDRTYPASNRELRRKIEQKGCVISEYSPDSTVGRNGFLQRNRLIAALSSALIVLEAQEKSGTMSTVAHAERYSKPVFAVPGSIFSANSDGTNRLLRDGRARAVCCGEDLFGLLGLRRNTAEPQEIRSAPAPMDDRERKVLACVGAQPRGVEELSTLSGLPTAVLLGVLMKLELSGRVISQPGKRYILR